MAKKSPGRPVKYSQERTPWCIWLDKSLAASVDKRRGKTTRPELITQLLRQWLGRKV